MFRKTLAGISAIALAACATEPTTSTAPNGSSSPTTAGVTQSTERPAMDSTFSRFVPSQSPRMSRARLDYELWDEMLDAMVINAGPSLRARASRPQPMVGSRVIYGHESPFRLEGNKIYFSGLDDEFDAVLTEYREDLERIANEVDLTQLNRNEQLAFWLNFYNVITIEQIALKYPVQKPSEMKVGLDQVLFDDAKIVNVKGVPLSLKDIRTKIVYANWKDSRVMYGFFRGDIGSPTIRNRAFTGENVSQQLDRNAREFVNSLRGIYRTGKINKVSPIYAEARPYYFNSWPGDLRSHLERFMDAEVREEIDLTREIEFQTYETRVADLSGGEPYGSKSNVTSTASGGPVDFQLPPSAMRMMQELDNKVQTLKEKGKLRGRVIIIDDVTLPGETEVE